jgi:hypothetical protein
MAVQAVDFTESRPYLSRYQTEANKGDFVNRLLSFKNGSQANYMDGSLQAGRSPLPEPPTPDKELRAARAL